jgi:hypothetical protein
MNTVERWDFFEVELKGPSDGNPYSEVTLSAQFTHKHRTVIADGFYDGDGVYRIRFMPDTLGEWRYVTRSDTAELNGHTGEIECIAPSANNHGPVSMHDTYHFAYADGAPHYSIGTTCYAWTHQGDALEEQTLVTLRDAPFNKMRMCVFPKHYTFNHNEPEYYPFERNADGQWDFTRFNPAFFQHFERCVGQLRDLGVEADIILFHPYDRWGFAKMDRESDHRYLRYIVARLAAYRNVWWSMANEYDLMLRDKPMAEWDRFFQIVQECDPHQHLRSIHNWVTLDGFSWTNFYDHAKPWVTHCSVQNAHLELVKVWREQYHKPVVVDECCYEGNIPNGWGNITAQEMVRRFWEGTVRGGYVGHGETYLDPNDVLWWSKGGVLHGGSAPRIAFLRRILEESSVRGLEPVGVITNTHMPSAGKHGEYYLTYFGWRQPGEVTFRLPNDGRYHADVIDTWEMTITPLDDAFEREFTIRLPTKSYMAIRLERTTH